MILALRQIAFSYFGPKFSLGSQVMAGTGNLDVLRIARQLRKRHSPDVPYGSHMAVHMAIGLLFLGAGRYQLNYLLIIQCTSRTFPQRNCKTEQLSI